ncbi:unnamed protein product [Lactuca virosa]|uniref:Uncharacterized protein n=1 Tax=Lactuca virosa TaxID=75947 RepID=A0AAU9MCU0_9ASTR|nr:unnamed protein product [Lactuca virosa]
MTTTSVTIVDDSGGSSSLADGCRSETENQRSSGDIFRSEAENLDLESVGACRYDRNSSPEIGGGDDGGATTTCRRYVGGVVMVAGVRLECS